MLIIFVPIFIISSEKILLYRLGSKIWSAVIMKDHIHHFLPFIV